MEPVISSDLIRGHIDTIILQSLSDSDKYAQQISDYVENKSNRQYIINQATLYSSLKRLVVLSYVEAYWQDADDGGRRKFFKLTEKGNNVLNDNLSSWSFSREIIDKLMDVKPISPTIIEIETKKDEVPSTVSTTLKTEAVDENVVIKQQPLVSDTKQDISDEKEVNFRSLLNDLTIKSRKSAETADIRPIINDDVSNVNDSTTTKQPIKLNETINDFFTVKDSYCGKIDLSDLSKDAEKNGYKIRISTKETAEIKGKFFINKLNLFSAFIVFFLFVLDLIVICTKYISVINTAYVVIGCLLTAIIPIASVALYIHYPTKTVSSVDADGVLSSFLVVFNLLLITFALNLILGADFSSPKIVFSFISPTLLYVNAFVFFAIRYCLSKSDFFRANTNKTTSHK